MSSELALAGRLVLSVYVRRPKGVFSGVYYLTGVFRVKVLGIGHGFAIFS